MILDCESEYDILYDNVNFWFCDFFFVYVYVFLENLLFLYLGFYYNSYIKKLICLVFFLVFIL